MYLSTFLASALAVTGPSTGIPSLYPVKNGTGYLFSAYPTSRPTGFVHPTGFFHPTGFVHPIKHLSSGKYDYYFPNHTAVPSADPIPTAFPTLILPTGIFPPGEHPTGVYPPGVYPSGVFPSGVYPTGGHSSGGYPTGVYPTGIFPTGTGAQIDPTDPIDPPPPYTNATLPPTISGVASPTLINPFPTAPPVSSSTTTPVSIVPDPTSTTTTARHAYPHPGRPRHGPNPVRQYGQQRPHRFGRLPFFGDRRP